MKVDGPKSNGEWKTVVLSAAAELNPTLPEKLEAADAVSFVPMSAVSAETAAVTNEQTRSFAEVAKGFTPFISGDVLVAKITPCFENGKIAQANISRRVGFGSTEFHVVRPRSGELDTRYVLHFLRQQRIRTAGQRRMTGSAGQRRVPENFLSSLEIPLPPLAEQRRIAEVLDRTESLRAKRRTAVAELDLLTQSFFLNLFGDPVVSAPCHPVQPLGTLLVRPLQNGAYFQKEKYCAESGVEMVHMSDAFYDLIVRGQLKRVACTRADIEKYSVTDSDILIARRSLNYEGAAKPCLIPMSEEPLIFESSLIRVTPRPDIITVVYLFHYLRNERVRQKWVYPLITQSTISGINQSNLAGVPVVVPSLLLQREFARRVAAVEKLKTTQRASLAELDALFASLQYRAFRGEL